MKEIKFTDDEYSGLLMVMGFALAGVTADEGMRNMIFRLIARISPDAASHYGLEPAAQHDEKS